MTSVQIANDLFLVGLATPGQKEHSTHLDTTGASIVSLTVTISAVSGTPTVTAQFQGTNDLALGQWYGIASSTTLNLPSAGGKTSLSESIDAYAFVRVEWTTTGASTYAILTAHMNVGN